MIKRFPSKVSAILLAVSILVAGCYRCEHSAEPDASVGEPKSLGKSGLLDWAVSLGEYSTSRPIILEAHEDGRISVLAGLSEKTEDGPDPYEFIGTFIMIFDEDGTLMEKKLVDELGFGPWRSVSDSSGYYLAGWRCFPCHGHIAKIDKEGTLLWKHEAQGNVESWFPGIELDKNGNVFLAGHYASTASTATFSLGDAEPLPVHPDSRETPFLGKIAANGQVLWLERLAHGMDAIASHIAFDDDQNVYVSGLLSSYYDSPIGPVTFGEGESSIVLESLIQGDGYVEKLSSNGELLWVMAVKNSWHPPHIANAHDGNLRIAGSTYPANEIAFEHPDHPVKNIAVSGLYLAEMSPDGQVDIFDSHNEMNCEHMSVATNSDGSTIISGSYSGESRIFTAVYGPSGDSEWVSFSEGDWFPLKIYSLKEAHDGSILSSGSWGLTGYDEGFGAVGPYSGTPVTFAPGTDNETTLFHEGIRYTGFLTKNFR